MVGKKSGVVPPTLGLLLFEKINGFQQHGSLMGKSRVKSGKAGSANGAGGRRSLSLQKHGSMLHHQ